MNMPVAAPKQVFSLAPQSIDEAIRLADMMSKSELVPKDFINKPGNILVAIQWGMELGLQPLQAMQNIAVINGRPSLWGDAVIALVKASPLCEYIVEETSDDQATCRVKRKGEPEQSRTFTKADAVKAGLFGKQGPWTQYPKRMLQMRARSWAVRDVFPDVLRGMAIAEEMQDMPLPGERNMGIAEIITPTGQSALPAYTSEQFDEKFPGFEVGIKAGKKTAEDIIAMIESKYVMSEEQKADIRAVVK